MSQYPHDAIQSFDSLPASAYVRLPVVKALLGVSSSTVWRLVKAGSLKAHKLTPRTTAFNVGQLREILDNSSEFDHASNTQTAKK